MTDRWTIGAGLNGGYVAAFGLRAAVSESTQPDPLSMTVHYLDRALPGPAEVFVETLRIGRGHTTLAFRVVQADLKAAGIVTFGRHRQPGPHDFSPPAPEPGPDPDDVPAPAAEQRPRIDALAAAGPQGRQTGGRVLPSRDSR